MIGRGGSNLQQIMAKTGASICFPDISSPKGTIVITGSIENTLAARNCIVVSCCYMSAGVLVHRCSGREIEIA